MVIDFQRRSHRGSVKEYRQSLRYQDPGNVTRYV